MKEIKKEKDRILEDMTKMQNKHDIDKEKVKSIEKKKKIEPNIKIFNKLVENSHEIPIEIREPDECIQVKSCEGNCDRVSELKQLNVFKQSGSDRSCPQTKPDDKPFYKCDKCDFMSQNKEYFGKHREEHQKTKTNECPQCGYKTEKKAHLETHIKEVHGKLPYCTICHVGLWSQEAVKKHIREHHFTETTHNSSGLNISSRSQPESHNQQRENKIRPCRYFRTRNGCKKGEICNFDHSEVAQIVMKVPKLCKDKEACVWKPQCKYVHPEDGEALPVRGEPRVRQGFGSQDFSRQPPGWINL